MSFSMRSLSQSRGSLLSRPSLAAREKTRRDFLAWLGAATATAAVGCATSSESEILEAQTYGAGEEPIDVSEAAQTACRATTRDARGPYWEAGAPVRTTKIAEVEEPGVRLWVEGRMVGPDCRTPLRDYALDVWQADAEGNYYRAGSSNYRLRGKIKTDAEGRYRFETVVPGRYGDAAGIRPAHLHVTFLSPGGNTLLTTQLYFEGDPYLGDADYCTAQGTCNSADPARALRLQNAWVSNTVGKKAVFDAIMPRT
jgi:catechol 1,2-dioxygenase